MMNISANKIDLSKNWKIRCDDMRVGHENAPMIYNKQDWKYNWDLPCDIHEPLIACGDIGEPLVGLNYKDCKWMEDRSWWFMKEFEITGDDLEQDVVELRIESLDGHADIYLNHVYLGKHTNAFYPFTKDVKSFLKTGPNVLMIRITCGLEYVSRRDSFDTYNCGTEEKGRVHLRKPQFVFGWDWAPRLATCGITGNVEIVFYNKVAIQEIHVFTKKLNKDGSADIGVHMEVENFEDIADLAATARIELAGTLNESIPMTKDILLNSGSNFIDFELHIENARLWWPAGMGEQQLYDIKADIVTDEMTCTRNVRFGIRTIEIDQTPINENERLFAFKINGIRTFCKGGNWVPSDSIYSRVKEEKYLTLINEARAANFNMLRVWGGGIYEREIFYKTCDEQGIMIWQDFMFACALYPDQKDEFRRSVENEIDYQTRRLRNHPCTVVWSGNNENQEAHFAWWKGVQKGWDFPGGKIYNYIAPKLIHTNCPEIPYRNGSPYGGENPNCHERGDRHFWQKGKTLCDLERKITPEVYDELTAKFVSEFGYVGPCCKKTVEDYLGTTEIDMNSEAFKAHTHAVGLPHLVEGQNKAVMLEGIQKHYGKKELTVDEYLLYGGLCQGMMYQYLIESMRWRQDCYGSLFWMYSDCWGETGWTIIDYYLRRKISYYFVKRAFAPVKFILRKSENAVQVVGINDIQNSQVIKLEYGYTSFDGKVKDNFILDVELKPFSRANVLGFESKNYDLAKGVCYVKPQNEKIDIPLAILRVAPFAELTVPKAVVKVSGFQVVNKDVILTVHTDSFAHGVHFGLDSDIHLSDEYFDLLPGESKEITIYQGAEKYSLEEIQPVCINGCLNK